MTYALMLPRLFFLTFIMVCSFSGYSQSPSLKLGVMAGPGLSWFPVYRGPVSSNAPLVGGIGGLTITFPTLSRASIKTGVLLERKGAIMELDEAFSSIEETYR
ncbi:MAG: hypothetical protein AAFV07_04850, partial [Bacteroidota bacterium]